MLADVSALVSRYSDSCDRGVSVSRIREPYNVVARVIVVGKLSRNALNANIVKSVAVSPLELRTLLYLLKVEVTFICAMIGRISIRRKM